MTTTVNDIKQLTIQFKVNKTGEVKTGKIITNSGNVYKHIKLLYKHKTHTVLSVLIEDSRIQLELEQLECTLVDVNVDVGVDSI